jgi:CheY-like chemotaxis protein
MSLNPESKPPSAPTKILIVDDSVIERWIAGGLVEKRPDLQPVFASNGREALEMILKENPALVLTDLQMPDIDGLNLVEAIRTTHPRIPVILMTAYGSEDIAIQALKAGAASYVPKKSLVGDLLETIDQVLAVAAVDRRRQRVLECLEERRSSFLLGNDPDLIAPLISLLQEDLDGIGFGDETTRTRVGVALQEALSNALYHGNLEVSTDLRQDDEQEYFKLAAQRRAEDPYCRRRILVRAEFDRGEATYVIRDEGPGFDTTILDKPIDPEDLMRVGGRGILLIRTFMDEVVFNEAGNQITLVKRRSPPGPPA